MHTYIVRESIQQTTEFLEIWLSLQNSFWNLAEIPVWESLRTPGSTWHTFPKAALINTAGKIRLICNQQP